MKSGGTTDLFRPTGLDRLEIAFHGLAPVARIVALATSYVPGYYFTGVNFITFSSMGSTRSLSIASINTETLGGT